DHSRLNFKDKTKDALHVIKHTVALEYALAVMKLYGQSLIINRADRIIQRAGRVSRDTANPIYISERDFLRVHHILMHNLLAPKQKHLSGKYKQEQNSIGGSELLLPLPDETPAYMKRWFEHSNKRLNGVFEGACIIEAAAWITHSFLMIHPFCDGNGRMSRILLNSILMSIGKMPFPIAIRGSAKKEKREYMKALDKASSRLSIFNADVGKTLDDYKLVIAKAIVKSFRQLDGKIIDQLSEDKAIRSYFD
ncbi:MAG: Fic family protein, partial [Lentisphaeraceae bacterium]|nr:Fic family protein [Lentisphaeraceae bacterium]